jgi:hypothetical protein
MRRSYALIVLIGRFASVSTFYVPTFGDNAVFGLTGPVGRHKRARTNHTRLRGNLGSFGFGKGNSNHIAPSAGGATNLNAVYVRGIGIVKATIPTITNQA